MRPGLADDHIVEEIVLAYYEIHWFETWCPENIASVLLEDFFDLGVTPVLATLSSLTVQGSLDTKIIPSELVDQFAPLIRIGQPSSHFNLHLHLRKYVDVKDEREMRTMVDRLGTLTPVFETIKANSIHCKVSMLLSLKDGAKFHCLDEAG
jgi:hypothetical protein